MATAKTFKIARTAGRSGRTTETEGTLAELIKHYGYTLQSGNSYNSKISLNPRSAKGLVSALNKCVNELQRGSYSPDDYDKPKIVNPGKRKFTGIHYFYLLVGMPFLCPLIIYPYHFKNPSSHNE